MLYDGAVGQSDDGKVGCRTAFVGIDLDGHGQGVQPLHTGREEFCLHKN